MLRSEPLLHGTLAIAVLLAARTTAVAEDGVNSALERVERAAEGDPQMSRETRDALRELVDALRGDRAAAASGSDGELRALIEQIVAESLTRGGTGLGTTVGASTRQSRFSLSGDLRLRHESNVHLDGRAPDRNRQRIRLRVAGTWQLDEQFSVGARLRTGSREDANSPHQTLGNGFDSFEVSLDRAYLEYRPGGSRNTSVWGGKFGSPLSTNPVYGELVWDADVQPEGIAIRHILAPSESAKLGLVAGAYAVIEQGSGHEATGVVAQTWYDTKLGDDSSGRLSISWHGLSDLTPDDAAGVLTDNQGNAVVTRPGGKTDFESDFSVLDLVASTTTSLGGLPLTVAGEWIHNLDARNSRDSGYALGLALGESSKPGDWKFTYQWQVVEQDAIASAFANDDFLLSSNHRSHFVGLRHQVSEAVNLQLSAYVSELDHELPGMRDTGHQWRLRIDLNIEF